MRISILPCLALAFLAAAPAEGATRNFGVSGFERIRVDGPFAVRVTTGVAPFARATGSPRALDRVKVEMQGRTMVIRADRSSASSSSSDGNSEPVEILVGTHELTSALLSGSGSLTIGRVRGLTFDLGVFGSGTVAIEPVAVDQFKLSAVGSANVRLSGTAKKVTAVLRGTSGLDATGLSVNDGTFGLEGPATIRATVTGTAKIDAQGPGTVTLSGSPACTSRMSGSASVTGCRTSDAGGR